MSLLHKILLKKSTTDAHSSKKCTPERRKERISTLCCLTIFKWNWPDWTLNKIFWDVKYSSFFPWFISRGKKFTQVHQCFCVHPVLPVAPKPQTLPPPDLISAITWSVSVTRHQSAQLSSLPFSSSPYASVSHLFLVLLGYIGVKMFRISTKGLMT